MNWWEWTLMFLGIAVFAILWFSIGFILCTILTMGKQADKFHQRNF